MTRTADTRSETDVSGEGAYAPEVKVSAAETKWALYFGYLDALRKSGVTNMYVASPYLANAFHLKQDLAITVLSAWMKTFSDAAPEARAKAALAARKMEGK